MIIHFSACLFWWHHYELQHKYTALCQAWEGYIKDNWATRGRPRLPWRMLLRPINSHCRTEGHRVSYDTTQALPNLWAIRFKSSNLIVLQLEKDGGYRERLRVKETWRNECRSLGCAAIGRLGLDLAIKRPDRLACGRVTSCWIARTGRSYTWECTKNCACHNIFNLQTYACKLGQSSVSPFHQAPLSPSKRGGGDWNWGEGEGEGDCEAIRSQLLVVLRLSTPPHMLVLSLTWTHPLQCNAQ